MDRPAASEKLSGIDKGLGLISFSLLFFLVLDVFFFFFFMFDNLSFAEFYLAN